MPRTASIKTQSPPQTLTIRVDTREQDPYNFASVIAPVLPFSTVRGTLLTGDYADDGRVDLPPAEQAVVERKSLSDLYRTMGKGRERFERECERLSEYGFAAIVVEAEWSRIMMPNMASPADELGKVLAAWPDLPANVREMLQAVCGMLQVFVQPGLRVQSKLSPKSAVNSLLAFSQRYGVHVIPCPGRRFAEQLTHRILERWTRDHA